jgi:ClpP class serine protease
VSRGLIDELGGISRAIQMAKQAAGLAADDAVRVLEVSRAKVSPLGGCGLLSAMPVPKLKG